MAFFTGPASSLLNYNGIPRANIAGPPTGIRDAGTFNIVLRPSNGGELAGPMGKVNTSFFSPQRATWGPTANGYAVAARIVRKFQHEGMVMEQKQMLMVVNRDLDVKMPSRQMTMRSDVEDRVSMFNVPMWNYEQARTEPKPEHPHEVPSAEDVWRDFKVDGVVKTETGEDPDGMDPSDYSNQERVINITLRGSCRTQNIWGVNIRPLTPLYLLLLKLEAPETGLGYRLNTRGGPLFPPNMGLTNGTTHMPYQLVPWADYRFNTPPDSVLQYVDEFGLQRRGLAIPVGHVDDVAEKISTNAELLDNCYRDVTAILSQPIIDVFVDPYRVVSYRY